MADQKHAEIADLLREDRTYAPPSGFSAHAHVRDESRLKSEFAEREA